MSPPLLELRQVVVRFGPALVLNDVTIAVERGTALAVLGANGAGKSTLARTISGLTRPSSGRVILDGRDVTTWAPHRRSRSGIAHVPDTYAVFPSLSVLENVRAGVRHFVHRNERAEAIERTWGFFPALADRRHEPARSLSGGQQRMLALARVLAAPPRLLVADEPLFGLAPLVVDEVLDALDQARKLGVAIMLVEQGVERAIGFADDALILRRGEVAWRGAAADARDRVVDDYLGRSSATG